MRIGFIGLGNMGGPMALNLIKAGHTLIVNDVRREAAAPHLDKGAGWADTPKAVAHESELVLTSLPRGRTERYGSSTWSGSGREVTGRSFTLPALSAASCLQIHSPRRA